MYNYYYQGSFQTCSMKPTAPYGEHHSNTRVVSSAELQYGRTELICALPVRGRRATWCAYVA
jgi:hypothetical protein